jgi:hypothetical protein
VGDVLVRAGERPVQGPADVLAGVISASGDEVPLQVIRSGKAMTVSLRARRCPARDGRRWRVPMPGSRS